MTGKVLPVSIPESSVAVTAMVNLFTSVVPRTMSFPPLTTTFVILMSPEKSSAWAAAGIVSADRARAPAKPATVVR